MVNLFSYVKYSEASFPMTGQYTALLLLTSVIWVLLWIGYRQNKINDEIKKKEKEERINAKTERRRKLESYIRIEKKFKKIFLIKILRCIN